MMIHSLIVLALALAIVMLVRLRLMYVDLFFPWFVAIAVLGWASTSPRFVDWLGAVLGIIYAPIAVIFLVLFLLLGVIVTLTVSLTRLRDRLTAMAKYEALRVLAEQERAQGGRAPT